MQDAFNPNRMTLINVAIAVAPTAGVFVCAISNTVVLHVAMVFDHAYRSEVTVLNHTWAEDSGSRPEIYAKLKNKVIDTKLFKIDCTRLR